MVLSDTILCQVYRLLHSPPCNQQSAHTMNHSKVFASTAFTRQALALAEN